MKMNGWSRVLLACGILSSLLYMATDIAGGLRYPGYDFTSQAISELMAVGAPSEAFVDPLFLLFGVLVLAFGVGVVRAGIGRRRTLVVAGGLLIAYAAIGFTGPTLFEMHPRGSASLGNDLPHIVITGVLSVLTLLTIGFGAFTLGERFRNYSFATILTIIIFGAFSAPYGAMLAAGQPTPGFGIMERILIYSSLLWTAVFATALLRWPRLGAAAVGAVATPVRVNGFVAPGFEEVRAEFERNFMLRGEIGAAVAAYWRGEKVVDLWGGRRMPDSDAPWNEDTMAVVMSTTKGMSAMALAVANSRGWLDYDAPVARYWPEFAQNGKGGVTVRQLLGHEAGIVLIDTPLTIEHMRDLDYVAGVLERQKPAWPPGTKHGYHAMTVGMYMQELIRRVDPEHRTLGQFFHDEIAEPLELEFYIGLPKTIPDDRLAKFLPFTATRALLAMRHTSREFIGKVLWPWSMLRRSLAILSDADLNERRCLEVEVPAGNGVGTARAIARAYSAFAEGGAELGIKRKTFTRVTALPAADRGKDEVLGVESYYSLGFLRPGPSLAFGSTQRAFGAPGAGGSFAFADPDAHLGYAYVMNKLDFYLVDDPREKALRDAIYRAIERLSPKGRPVRWVETPAAAAHTGPLSATWHS